MTERRTYNSAVRDAAARRTRKQLVDAAEELFLEAGYAETTITAIAARAGVSGQTVYNTFGTKAALLKHLYDVRIVGDDDPIPVAQRPDFRRLATLRDGRQVIDGYLRLGAGFYRRVGPLVRLIAAGAIAGDRDLAEVLATTAAERLIGATNLVARLVELGALRPGVGIEEARDVVWAMTGIEVWDLFGRQRGWPEERLVDWLVHTISAAVL